MGSEQQLVACPICGLRVNPEHRGNVYMDGWHHTDCLDGYNAHGGVPWQHMADAIVAYGDNPSIAEPRTVKEHDTLLLLARRLREYRGQEHGLKVRCADCGAGPYNVDYLSSMHVCPEERFKACEYGGACKRLNDNREMCESCRKPCTGWSPDDNGWCNNCGCGKGSHEGRFDDSNLTPHERAQRNINQKGWEKAQANRKGRPCGCKGEACRFDDPTGCYCPGDDECTGRCHEDGLQS